MASSALTLASRRTFCTSSCLCGKRSRDPFDKRFPVTAKHVNEHVKGGSKEMEERVAVHRVQPTGLIDPITKKFRNIPEMIPEFIVPDLTDFKLKPYVSYNVTDIVQSKFTARDLFNACYAPKIIEDFKAGKLIVDEESPKSKS